MKYIFLTLLFSISVLGNADEGMFLPFQLKKNQKDMAAKGLELKVKQIYNPKKPSVKDAIVSLGGFCTGELISPKGLMLTNHHCGYDAIRENSTPENDYLTDGFWAQNYSEEKPVPGLTASIVVRIQNVSKTINKALKGSTSPSDREATIALISKEIVQKATRNNHYEAEVKTFYEGNEFYLFVYEVFKDVRLVGAPPSAIGKYGGDTDNWMWERHTGDFSMFRVYAGEGNRPAEFAMTNKPYVPKHFLPVSTAGVQENDFAMVMGYPGSTDRYLTSYGVKMAIEKDQPSRVKVRAEKLRIMKEDMNASDAVRLQYASNYAQVSNYWKYFIGQSEQLTKNNVMAKKLDIEKAFSTWIKESDKRKQRYGNVLNDMENSYKKLNEINAVKVYFYEAIYSVNINQFVISHRRLHGALGADEVDTEFVKKFVDGKRKKMESFYSSINMKTEMKLINRMIAMYFENIPTDQLLGDLADFKQTYGENWSGLLQKIKNESIFTDQTKYAAYLDNPTLETLDNDVFFKLDNAMMSAYFEIVSGEEAALAQSQLDDANRLFVEGLRKMYPDKNYYPNANSSLRLSYGNVLPYTSNDGKKHPFYTTMKGLMAKEDPNNPEFIVPAKLKALYENKDYGNYAKDGELWVNFITNNDITGGNSGSPVINARGELIGCAFDGNWEAMSGDIAFEKDFQRTISVDIRYILFIIDKYAGASHLIDEMTLVN